MVAFEDFLGSSEDALVTLEDLKKRRYDNPFLNFVTLLIVTV